MSQSWRAAATDLLARDAWFASLPEALKARLVAAGDMVRLRAGESLYHTGDAADGFYAVLSGDLRARRIDGDGAGVLLDIYGPGSWVGVVLTAEAAPVRTLDVVAASSAQLLFISAAAYREIVTAEPSHAEWFGRLASKLAEEAREALFDQRLDASRRTARTLMRIADLHGREAAGGIELRTGLSQGELASLVGVSRQYMNTLLARWQREGSIVWGGESFPVVVPQRMAQAL